MPMFLPDEIKAGRAVFIEDAPHIARTLRHTAGDTIRAVDGQGHVLTCRLTEVSPKKVIADITQCQDAGTEPEMRITVVQAICKNQKMEQVVRYSVPLTVDVGTGKTWLEAH